MDQAVDGCRGGHCVLEDLLPLAERQIAGQHHTASFISFGQQGEEHLHFFSTLLYISQIVDDQPVKGGQLLDDPG